MPSSAREEAERLVAAVFAMANTSSGKNEGLGVLGDLVGKVAGAALGHGSGSSNGSGSSSGSGGSSGSGSPSASGGGSGHSGHSGAGSGSGGSWATGSAECCVCPVCRVIAAMRDPSPDTAAKLAIGAGDLANGVASMMRAVSSITGDRPAPRPAKPQSAKSADAWSDATRNTADQAWSTATNKAADKEEKARDPETDPWGAASAASAETVQAERRAAAKAAAAAAAEAARRVEEAAARARASRVADVVQNTTPEVAPGGRTPQRFDVWAAATADAGADNTEPAPDVDHEDRNGDQA
jgi:hypothetical protein